MINIFLKKIVYSSFLFYLAGCSSVDPYQKVEVIYGRRATPYYTVEEGDTVQSVSSKYAMDEAEFIEINKLSSPFELIPGQKLLVHPKAISKDGKNASSSDEVYVSQTEEKPKLNEEKKDEHQDHQVQNSDVADQASSDDEKTTDDDSQQKKTSDKKHLKWPVHGRVVKKYGDNKNGQFSKGISISAPEGTPVYPAKDGVVLKSNVDLEGFGKTVVVQHDDGMMTVYSHLKLCIAKQGSKVTTKTVIGRVGKTGGIKKPELHFQLRDKNKESLNPLSYLR